MAKPFVKWAGGKGKLLKTLEKYLPSDFEKQESISYIEPFVGGGAMLFYMLERYKNINKVIINDINPELIACYRQIQNEHENLIQELRELENKHLSYQSHEERRKDYEANREEYNELHLSQDSANLFEVRKVALFIYLNKTCFNGLYRENRRGIFNVPFGRYAHPTICNESQIIEAHNALQGVQILNDDYHVIKVNPNEYSFVYIDPPYKPLPGSNNFKEYTKFMFGDEQQIELKLYCDELTKQNAKIMVSNSFCKDFFKELYQGYSFQAVLAPRYINAFAANRNPIYELLIKNY